MGDKQGSERVLGIEWERYRRLQEERPDLFIQSDVLRIVTDEDVIAGFQQESGRVIGVAYASPWRLMLVDLVEDGSGRRFAYERVVPAKVGGSAVVTVAVRNGYFLLVEQFCHPIRARQLGFVRGFGEPGLSAEENARKELAEELGAHVTGTNLLGTVVADSGLDGTEVAVTLCEVDSYEVRIGHEGIVGAREVAAAELWGMVAAGDVTDGFTLSALALLSARRGDLL